MFTDKPTYYEWHTIYDNVKSTLGSRYGNAMGAEMLKFLLTVPEPEAPDATVYKY
jgi:hypothetical protein